MSYNNYFKEIDISLSLDEKIAAIKANIERSALIRAEIRELNSPAPPVITSSNPHETIPIIKKNKTTFEDKELKDLYDKISLLDISNLSEEDIITKLKSIIKIGINQFLINRIKLLLYKEFIIYNKMLLSSKDNNEIKELREILGSIKTKINLLDEIIELEDEEEITEIITEENNNIFFLLSDSGKIIALESIRKNIPKDYYYLVKQMINNLKTGKASDIKKLTMLGFYELRVTTKGPGIRLIFDKLNSGNYIIIDCFMKKVEGIGLSIRTTLDNRYNQFQNKKKYYLMKCNEPDFIQEHEEYLTEILALLDDKTLEGDELNEGRTI